jgi:Alpha/beta hydrolase
MTLTLADVDTWDAAAIDEVFAAATARAEGARAAGDSLRELLSFIPWEGRAAEAARDSAHRIKLTLGGHGERCGRIADAARRAAAEVADLKYRLARIRADADEAFISIDDRTGTLVPRTAVLTLAQLRHREGALRDLPRRISRLLSDADTADRDLAAAMQKLTEPAGGLAGDPSPAGPLPQPPPPDASPADVKKWWDGLTAQQRVDCITRDPAAIDRDGIPCDIRDTANRTRLHHEIGAATTALDAATHNEAAYWEYVNTHHGEPPPGCTEDPVAALADARAWYDDLIGIQSALYAATAEDRRSLILLDTKSNPRHVLGAIAVGDVDRAARVGVTTGGVTTNATDLPRMADEATQLRQTTRDILGRAGDAHPESVAAIAWVGYEPPVNLADVRVLGDGVARAAAPRLNSLLNGLAATTANPRQEITAFGHSYGSLVTSLALQQGSPVTNAVFFGSPGLELGRVEDLRLAPGGHAYYEQAPGDPIALMQLAPSVLDAIPIIGPELKWLFGSGAHRQLFGDTPNEIPGITQLSTAAGADPVLGEQRAGARGHSEYQREDGNHVQRMSGYNLAAVLSGVHGATKTGP